MASQGNFSSYGYIIPARIVKNFLDIVEREAFVRQDLHSTEFSIYEADPSNTVPNFSSKSPGNPPSSQDDTNLKIAKCQADKQATYDQGIVVFNEKVVQVLEPLRQQESSIIDQLRNVGQTVKNVFGNFQNTPDEYGKIVASETEALEHNLAVIQAQIKQEKEYYLQDAINMLKIALSEKYTKCLNQ